MAAGYLQRPATLYRSAQSSKFEAASATIEAWAAWCAGAAALAAERPAGGEWRPPAEPEAAAAEYRRRRAADARWGDADDESRLLAKEAETETDAWKSSSVPAITPAGRFEGAREAPHRIHWTGLLTFEADKMGPADAVRYRNLLAADPRVALASLSLSGGGVWFSVLVDREPVSLAEYARLWVIVEAVLQAPAADLPPLLDASISRSLDAHVKDATRLRFASYDPDFAVKPDPQPIPVPADPKDVVRIHRRLLEEAAAAERLRGGR